MNFPKEDLPFIKLWARDDLDYHLIEHGDEFCIMYLLSNNLWAFILHSTILDKTIIANDLKKRNYHIIFTEECIDTWHTCNMEQYVIDRYVTFNSYAYIQ